MVIGLASGFTLDINGVMISVDIPVEVYLEKPIVEKVRVSGRTKSNCSTTRHFHLDFEPVTVLVVIGVMKVAVLSAARLKPVNDFQFISCIIHFPPTLAG
jgi:hypothetical protein